MKKRLTGTRNQCGGCREYFNSVTAFEKHRIGKFGIDRRCMTPDEMTAAKMEINRDGFWISEPNSNRRSHDATEEEGDTVME